MALPILLRDINNKLDLKGGTLTGNHLYIANGEGEFQSYGDYSAISAKGPANFWRALLIGTNVELKESARVIDYSTGSQRPYLLYGEHNKPTASDIGASPNSHTHENYYNYDLSRSANTVLAAPNGSAGSATFRKLVSADIPNLDAGKITSGAFSISRGGTGATTAQDARANLELNAVKIDYKIDLSSYSTSNFYLIDFGASDHELDVEIHSPNLSGAEPYNQNEIHFLLTHNGWSDTPKSFQILHQGCYASTELTIMSIVVGAHAGLRGVYVRGGMVYRIRSNFKPTLNTTTRTHGDESYGSGTTSITILTNASTLWNNDGTKKSYFDSIVVGSDTNYATAKTRNVAANTSLSTPTNGDIFLVYT